nr:hypothetical protein [Providencia stuartii]
MKNEKWKMKNEKLRIIFLNPMEYENLEVELLGSDLFNNFIAKLPLGDLMSILVEVRDTLKNKD